MGKQDSHAEVQIMDPHDFMLSMVSGDKELKEGVREILWSPVFNLTDDLYGWDDCNRWMDSCRYTKWLLMEHLDSWRKSNERKYRMPYMFE